MVTNPEYGLSKLNKPVFGFVLITGFEIALSMFNHNNLQRN